MWETSNDLQSYLTSKTRQFPGLILFYKLLSADLWFIMLEGVNLNAVNIYSRYHFSHVHCLQFMVLACRKFKVWPDYGQDEQSEVITVHTIFHSTLSLSPLIFFLCVVTLSVSEVEELHLYCSTQSDPVKQEQWDPAVCFWSWLYDVKPADIYEDEILQRVLHTVRDRTS